MGTLFLHTPADTRDITPSIRGTVSVLSGGQIRVVGIDGTLNYFGKFDLTRWQTDGVIGGTITKIQSMVDGVPQWTATGLSMDASSFSLDGFTSTGETLLITSGGPLSIGSLTSGALPLVVGSESDDYLLSPFSLSSVGSYSMKGGGGDDVLIGYGIGQVTLDGGSGDDYIELRFGSGGTLIGGAGNDIFYRKIAADANLVGGTGTDSVWYGITTEIPLIGSLGYGPDLVFENPGYGGFVLTRLGDDKVAVSLISSTSLYSTSRDVLVGVENIVFNGVTFNIIELPQNSSTSIADTYVGSVGDDTFYGADGDDSAQGGLGNDVLGGDAGNDRLEGGNGNDSLFGGEGNDLLYGGSGDDTLNAGIGQDFVDGGVGIDLAVLDSTKGAYYFEGISSTEVRVINIASRQLDVLLNVERIRFSDGLEGNLLPGDLLAKGGTRGNDVFRGSDEIDTFGGMEGNDNISGIGGDDVLSGGAGKDTLDGGSGNDYLSGNIGNDVILGGDGDDLIDGGTGADRMLGGTGNDIYIVDALTDTVIENAAEGVDTIRTGLSSWSLKKLPSVENLDYLGSRVMTAVGNDLDNVMTTAGGSVSFNGGAGNDTLIGGSGIDNLVGGAGNDRLSAGAGSRIGAQQGQDKLSGGDGNDILIAGPDWTIMHGGTDADVFVFETKGNYPSAQININDFISGEDKIALELDQYSQLSFTDGNLDAGQFKMTSGYSTAQTAQDRLIYHADTGYLYFDPDGSGAASMVMVAQLGSGLTHPSVSATDFMGW